MNDFRVAIDSSICMTINQIICIHLIKIIEIVLS